MQLPRAALGLLLPTWAAAVALPATNDIVHKEAAATISSPILSVLSENSQGTACPAVFKNTVFNTDAVQEKGSISNTWSTLAAHSVIPATNDIVHKEAAATISSPILSVLSENSQGTACPAVFKNTVFNTDAVQEKGSISNTWSTLAAHSVNEFIAFTLYPLWNSSNYKTNDGKQAPHTPVMDAHQFRMIGGLAHINDAIAMITDPKTAPPYLELLNEPDLNKLDPVKAAKALEPLFKVVREKKTNTVLVGNPVADNNGGWSQKFYQACNGCSDLIPIQGMHVYKVDPDEALSTVEAVHKSVPDKKIWVTETSPSTLGGSCELSDKQVAAWMEYVLPRLHRTGYVDRVFWNRGTYKVRPDGNCDTSLVDGEGNARPLLETYKNLKC